MTGTNDAPSSRGGGRSEARRGRAAPALSLVPWVAALLLVQAGSAQTADPVGIWNLEMRNLSERATGGVQHELLKIEEADGELRARMTAPDDRFLPVQSFDYEDGTMDVRFAVYEYTLEIEGDRVSGRMTSPVDTLDVTGARQESRLYSGDEPEDWVTTRTGILGHRTDLAPPEDEADPKGWVTSRIDSPDDLALVVRGHAVTFTNAEAFGEELLSYAGQRVDVRARWIGEQLRIEEIDLADREGR